MAQEIYTGPASIYFRGLPVLQTETIRMQLQTNNKAVITGRNGRSGHTKGPKSYTVAVANAVPLSGPEVDWFGLADAQELVTLSVRLARKTYTLEGDIRDVEFNSEAEGGAVKLSFNFDAKLVSTT